MLTAAERIVAATVPQPGDRPGDPLLLAKHAARRTSWTAPDLLAAEFPAPRWAVPGIVAEGLTLLVGAPKVGKSWAALNLAVAVASGGKAFGRVDVEPGSVLYLALEDTPRRLQSRLRKVLHGDPAPARLAISTVCEPLTAGGAERITTWLEGHPATRLVVIDVLARVRGRSSQQVSAYEADYAPLATLKGIADRFGVAILVLRHTRKAGAEDFMDEVSGTQGLNGAADATLVLKRSRGQADATLQVSGRDIGEAEYALTFAPDVGTWTLLLGPAEDYTLGDTRARVLTHLREHGPSTPKQIAEALAIDHAAAKQACYRMSKDGQLDTDGRGFYFPLSPVTPVTVSPKIAEGDTPAGHLSPATPPLTWPGDSGDRGDSDFPPSGDSGYGPSEETP